MPTFQSRWLSWEPTHTPIQRTDRTDKSPSVSFVSASTKRVEGESAPADHTSAEPGCIQKTPPKAPMQRTYKADKSTRPTEETWDGEMAELVRWFLGTHPPTEPFELCRGIAVIKPALWWAVMRRELVLGPHGTPRARTGALQQDLRLLHALMKRE